MFFDISVNLSELKLLDELVILIASGLTLFSVVRMSLVYLSMSKVIMNGEILSIENWGIVEVSDAGGFFSGEGGCDRVWEVSGVEGRDGGVILVSDGVKKKLKNI